MRSVHFVVLCCVAAAAVSLFQLMRAGFNGSLFSYHPVLMCLGFGVLLPVGVSQARLRLSASSIETRFVDGIVSVLRVVSCTSYLPGAFPTSRLFPARACSVAYVQRHVVVQLAATVLIAVAFGAIFLNKRRAGKDHFTTWHAWAGLLAVCCVMGNAATVRGAGRPHCRHARHRGSRRTFVASIPQPGPVPKFLAALAAISGDVAQLVAPHRGRGSIGSWGACAVPRVRQRLGVEAVPEQHVDPGNGSVVLRHVCSACVLGCHARGDIGVTEPLRCQLAA